MTFTARQAIELVARQILAEAQTPQANALIDQIQAIMVGKEHGHTLAALYVLLVAHFTTMPEEIRNLTGIAIMSLLRDAIEHMEDEEAA